MDINQLKTWADVMDKLGAISLVVAGLAVVVLGVSTWLSIKFNSRILSGERVALTQFKSEAGQHAQQLEAKVAALEQSVDRAQQQAAEAARRAAMLERQVGLEKERSALLEGLVAEAERKAEAARSERAPESPSSAAETKAPDQQPAAQPTAQPAAKLAKYAGAKAAVFALEESPVAANVALVINATLTQAGLSSSVWQWKGVGGIEGIVVLTKEGRDAATDEAAAGIVEVLRASGFNTSKANWPADWRRYRGTLAGPQVPDPTDAPIRIVIGANTGP